MNCFGRGVLILGRDMIVPPLYPERFVMFHLESHDGIIVDIEKKAACKSDVIKGMVNHMNITDPDDPALQDPIKLHNISGRALKKIADWCMANRDEEYVPKGEDEDQRIALSPEDLHWMMVSNELLLEMLFGASHLSIPRIVDIITQKIANMGIGKTVEELRELYGLENDFTPEEEEENRRRFAWAFQDE